MYNKLLKLEIPQEFEKHKKLLLEQYQYGCFDYDFKKEILNFINKYTKEI